MIAAAASMILVYILSKHFSIAEMVFAIYGAQVGLCPLVIAALLVPPERLKGMSAWAAAAVSAGFIAAWGAALSGGYSGNTDLIYLAPVFSLVVSTTFWVSACSRTAGCGFDHELDTHQGSLQGQEKRAAAFEAGDRADAIGLSSGGVRQMLPQSGFAGGDGGGGAAHRCGCCREDCGGLLHQGQGTACCLLKDGLCSIYAHRPRGCIEYPWYNIGGRLYYDQGCPGIRHDRDERPNAADIGPFENFFAGTPRAIVRLIRAVCTRP